MAAMGCLPPHDAEPPLGLYWPGKAAAFAAAAPAATLLGPARPLVPGGSTPDDRGHRILIGDNLAALQHLRTTAAASFHLIYIDPPYNQGVDYLYRDGKGTGKHRREAWLDMMAPRLLLSRELLRRDGVLFLSIGDEELATLRLLGEEIFGSRHFVACVPRITKRSSNKGRHFAPSKDYLLVFARHRPALPPFHEVLNPSRERRFRHTDARGRYATVALYQHALDPRPNQRYWIRCPDGSYAIPPGPSLPDRVADGAPVLPQGPADRCWRWTAATYLRQRELLVFRESGKSPLRTPDGTISRWNVHTKYYLSDRRQHGHRPRDFLDGMTNDQGTAELRALGLDDCFPFAKPTALVQRLLQWRNEPTAQVLDFFAGSGTTAAAVLAQNAADGGSRRFVLVQEAAPTGRTDFPTIADLTLERVRRELLRRAEPATAVTVNDVVLG
jgi:adenine-specific DNA-methyltransferase